MLKICSRASHCHTSTSGPQTLAQPCMFEPTSLFAASTGSCECLSALRTRRVQHPCLPGPPASAPFSDQRKNILGLCPTLTMMAGEAKTGTSLTLISVLSVGGFAVYVVYWRFLRSQAEPCRLKAPTTALQALAFHTCSHTAGVSSLHLGATPVRAASHVGLCSFSLQTKEASSWSGAAGKAEVTDPTFSQFWATSALQPDAHKLWLAEQLCIAASPTIVQILPSPQDSCRGAGCQPRRCGAAKTRALP